VLVTDLIEKYPAESTSTDGRTAAVLSVNSIDHDGRSKGLISFDTGYLVGSFSKLLSTLNDIDMLKRFL